MCASAPGDPGPRTPEAPRRGTRLGELDPAARLLGRTLALPLRAQARCCQVFLNPSALMVPGRSPAAPPSRHKRCLRRDACQGTGILLLPSSDPGASGGSGSGEPSPSSATLRARRPGLPCPSLHRVCGPRCLRGAGGGPAREPCLRRRGPLWLPAALVKSRVGRENAKERIPPTCALPGTSRTLGKAGRRASQGPGAAGLSPRMGFPSIVETHFF